MLRAAQFQSDESAQLMAVGFANKEQQMTKSKAHSETEIEAALEDAKNQFWLIEVTKYRNKLSLNCKSAFADMQDHRGHEKDNSKTVCLSAAACIAEILYSIGVVEAEMPDQVDSVERRVDADPPDCLQDGYACANPECPQAESYRTAIIEAGQEVSEFSIPIVGTRFVCNVCIPEDGQIHPQSASAMHGGVARLSFCDGCMHGHDSEHPLTMHRRAAPDCASTIRTKKSKKRSQKYVVQGILGDRIVGKVKEYHINWQGPYWHSWHTALSLGNATLINDYEAAKKPRPEVPRISPKRKKLRRAIR